MNFINGGYRFDVRTAKVNEKEKEEKGKEVAKETKPAEKPAEAPETVVLTGSAQEIQAVLNKATVAGLQQIKPNNNPKDDPTEWEQILELLENYQEEISNIENIVGYDDRINECKALQEALLAILHSNPNMPSEIESIVVDELEQVIDKKTETISAYYNEMNTEEKTNALQEISDDVQIVNSFLLPYIDPTDPDNTLSSIQDLIENILDDPTISDELGVLAANELAQVIDSKVDAWKEYYDDNASQMTDEAITAMLQEIGGDLNSMNELFGEENINLDDLINTLASMYDLTENVLGGEDPNSDIWSDAHSLQAQVIFAEVEAMQKNYDETISHGNNFNAKWAYLASIEDCMNQLDNHGGYGAGQNEIDSLYGEAMAQILGHKYALIHQYDEDNLSDISEFIEQYKDSVEDLLNQNGGHLTAEQIQELFDEYMNVEEQTTAATTEHINNPPPQNGSMSNMALDFLNRTGTIQPNYEFIFRHQSNSQNYSYFSQQVDMLSATYSTLQNYYVRLLGMVDGQTGNVGKGNLSQREQIQVLRLLQNEMERIGGLLADARNYKGQLEWVGSVEDPFQPAAE